MDFEAIFGILFILMIVLFQVIGSLLKRSGEADTGTETDDKPAGLGRRLKEVVERIKKEIETANQAETPPPPASDGKGRKTGARPGGWETVRPKQPERTHVEEQIIRQPLSERKTASGGTARAAAAGGGENNDDPPVYRTPAQKAPRPGRTTVDRRDKPEKFVPASGSPATIPRKRTRTIEQKRILELRRAVVWAEILAPPLALRQDQDQT